MDISSIKLFEEETWVDNLTILAALILPGFCYFYFVKPTFFEEISFSKLIVISFFYSTIPFFLTHMFLKRSSYYDELKKIIKEREKDIQDLIGKKMDWAGHAPKEIIYTLDNLINKLEKRPSANYYLQAESASIIILITFSILGFCFLTDTIDSIISINTRIITLEISTYFLSLIILIVLVGGILLLWEHIKKNKK